MFKLHNGIRIISIDRQFQQFVTIRIYVKICSHLNQKKPGLAHFVEHMLFRSYRSESYGNIYWKIESLGGKLEANTSKEFIDISLTILKENFQKGLDILADIITQPTFTCTDIEEEREIISEEIANSFSRSKILWDLFAGAIWEKSPFVHPVTGTIETINTIALNDVSSFYGNSFTGENIVISIIGNFDISESAKRIENLFASIPKTQEGCHYSSPVHVFGKEKTLHFPKDAIQSHLVIGYPGVGLRHPEIHTFKLLNKILGHGLSSRLYQRLKVTLHLVYSVSSVLSVYEDTGYFAIWANFNKKKAKRILDVIIDEITRLKQQEIPSEELDIAKIRYKRDFLMTLESDFSAAGYLAASELLTGNIEDVLQTITHINDITGDRIIKLANRFFLEDSQYIVLVGQTL